MRLAITIFLASLCFLTVFTGCNTALHPVMGKDYKFELGQDQNWSCFNDAYLKEVMKVKVGQ